MQPNSLSFLSLDETQTYLDAASGDEIEAARLLATDRNALAGAPGVPDAMEIHHALFLMRRARGLAAPSYDDVRVELQKRAA